MAIRLSDIPEKTKPIRLSDIPEFEDTDYSLPTIADPNAPGFTPSFEQQPTYGTKTTPQGLTWGPGEVSPAHRAKEEEPVPKERYDKRFIEDMKAVGQAINIMTDPTNPESQKIAGELYDRMSWFKTYVASLGGRVGPKGLRRELLEEAGEFGGFGPAVMPAAGKTVTLAVEWGILYPALFRAAGYAGGLIGRIPKVQQGIKALKSLGGIAKVAKEHPQLYAAAENALKAFGKGETVGQTMAAIESIAKDKPFEQWVIDMNKRGALMGGIATVFSAAHSYDNYRHITQTSKYLKMAAYQRHQERISKGMPEKTSGELLRQEGDKIKDVIYYYEAELLGQPKELLGGKKPKLTAKQAAEKLAKHGYNFAKAGKSQRELAEIKQPKKPLDVLLRPKEAMIGKTKVIAKVAPKADHYLEFTETTTGRKVAMPAGKYEVPKGWTTKKIPFAPAEAPPPPVTQAAEITKMDAELAEIQKPAHIRPTKPTVAPEPTKIAPKAAEAKAEPPKMIEPVEAFETRDYKSVGDFKNKGEFLDYIKPKLKETPHPHVPGSKTVRPYVVGYGCDGSTDANIHYVAQKMCKLLGLDYAEIYDKAYAWQKRPSERDWLGQDLGLFKDESLKTKPVKDTTIIPKNATIQNVLDDLYDINNRSLVAELEKTLDELKIDYQTKLSDIKPAPPAAEEVIEGKVVYRGDIEAGRKLEAKIPSPTDLRGIYFTEDKELAQTYADMGRPPGEKGYVGQYKVVLKNPANDAIENEILKSLGAEKAEDGVYIYTPELANQVADELQRRGYDSLIRETGEIIVFDKSQVARPAAETVREGKVALPETKVIDEAGKPLIVYHGTKYTFKKGTFSIEELGKATKAASAKEGFFFTKDKIVAEGYAEAGDTEKAEKLAEKYIVLEKKAQRTGRSEDWDAYDKAYLKYEKEALKEHQEKILDPTRRVEAVYLDIKKPLVKDYKGESFRDEKYFDVIKKAKEQGNDGVIFKNTYDNVGIGDTTKTDIYVVFNESQIISVRPAAKPETKDEYRARISAEKAAAKVEETDEKLSGIKKARRRRLIKEVGEDIKKTDIYSSLAEGLKGRPIDVGYYYVPKKFKAEVLDIIGEPKRGRKNALQKMFTFDPREGATDWTKEVQDAMGVEDELGQYDTSAAMDISDFVQAVKDAHEGKKKVGALNAAALERAKESGDPYLEYQINKYEMLRNGFSVDEIDEMTRQWAEDYEVPLEELDTEWVGPEAIKIKDLKGIKDEKKLDAEIEKIARDRVLRQERKDAGRAVNEILKANDLDVKVKEVEEIEYEDEVPFETRGVPTGATIVTPAGKEIVLLAFGADSATGYHEGYHLLRRRLRKTDKIVLERHFKSEEAEAVAFGEFAKTNKAPTSMIKAIWQKLLRVLRKIKSALEGQGYRTVGDIFGEIQAGRIAKVAPAGAVTKYERNIFGEPTYPQKFLSFPERKKAIARVAKQEAKDKKAKVVAKKTGKPFAAWRPAGRVPIKSALIKEVDKLIQQSMKPRDNSIHITPEEINKQLYGRFGWEKIFYEPYNSLPEVQEAWDQLVKGGPLFDVKYEVKPIWYSKLDRLITDKMPNKMLAPQLKAWAKKSGIKDEEMDWSGLNELEGKVTKQQVLDTIRANNMQIEEVEKQREKKVESEFADTTDETKFAQYTLPGGERYRELLLRLPPKGWVFDVRSVDDGTGSGRTVWEIYNTKTGEKHRAKNGMPYITFETKRDAQDRANKLNYQASKVIAYKAAHWEETNVLAHVRFNDRTDSEGKKVLFIEEIQSDWHQKGRKEGYREKLEPVTELPDFMKIDSWTKGGEKYYQVLTETVDGKPAIFTGGYHSKQKAIKRALEKLNEARIKQEGKIPDAPFKKTWQELAMKRMLRYAAENGYDKIAWTTGEQQADRYDLSKYIESVNAIKGKQGISLTVTTKEGRNVIDSKLVQPNELDNIIGKELADKIRQQKEPEHTYSGLDLKVGGEGMKAFYDRIIPSFLNKYTKKWGGRVGTTEIDTEQYNEADRMLGSFDTRAEADAAKWRKPGLKGEDAEVVEVKGYREGKEETYYNVVLKKELATVPSLDITPSMVESVMAGQVMYETKADKLIRDVMRKAQVEAEKARIKRREIKRRRKGPALKRIKIKIDEKATPGLVDEWLKGIPRPPMPPKPLGKVPVQGQEYSPEWYEQNRKKVRARNILSGLGETVISVGKGIDRAIDATEERLYRLSPELFRRTRKYAQSKAQRFADMIQAIKPFVKATHKMSRADWTILDLALKNRDRRMIYQILAKYDKKLGTIEKYETFRDIEDEIYEAANEVGIDMRYLREHTHRFVKDTKGFLKYFQQTEHWSAIMEAVKSRAKRSGRKIDEITDDEIILVINSLLRGYTPGAISLARPGAAKERTIGTIDKNLNRFYADSRESIIRYLRVMNTKIAAREFFGGETREIRKIRGNQSARLTRLSKYRRGEGLAEGASKVKYRDHIKRTEEALKADNERLERLQARPLEETVGGYVFDLWQAGIIEPTQERELKGLLRSLFDPKGMGRIMSFIKTAMYLDTLNSPIHAVTQLEEISFALYRYRHRAVPALIRTIARKSHIKPKDVGIQTIGIEFEGRSMEWALKTMLASEGFTWADNLGKETLINAALSKLKSQAMKKKRSPAFTRKIVRAFGKNYKEVIEDLKKAKIENLKRGDMPSRVKYLLWCEVADFQPISELQTPQYYNRAGNWRILYTLKTFYLKRFSALRREAFRDMKHIKTFPRGFSNMVQMLFWFALLGAGTDWLKDFILGRAFDLKDSIIDTIARVGLLSKYEIYAAGRDRPSVIVARKLMPPLKIIDAIWRDYKTITSDKHRGFELWRSVPIVGEMYYWWFGRGRERIEEEEETTSW